MTREEKLEAALKSALRMRRGMRDLGEWMIYLLAPRELVVDFDNKMKALTEDKTDERK